MADDDGIEQLGVVLDRALVFLDRPRVLEQFLALALVLIASRAAAWIVWWPIDVAWHRWRGSRNHVQPHALETRTSFRLVRSLTTHTVGIVLAIVTQNQLAAAGYVTGLLEQLIGVFVVLLVAEVVMAVVTIPLDTTERRRYRRRFFRPLTWIVVGLMVLDHLADLSRLADASAFDLFGSPVSLGALFVATLGIWFWTDAVNLLNVIIVSVVSNHTSLNDGSAEATLMLVRYGLILLGVTYGISQLQLAPATVAAITGGLSVGVGFGLREVLANFISGTFILLERSLRPGDIVEIDGEMGTVEKLSVRSTTVRTLDNEEIVLPNSAFFTDKFKSFTGTDAHVRFNIIVMANCNNDPEQVCAVLSDVASRQPGVLTSPRPEVWVEDQFGNNVVTYRLHMWTSTPLAIPRTKSDVVRAVWSAFRDTGIELVFPDLELHFNDTAGMVSPTTLPARSPDTTLRELRATPLDPFRPPAATG